MSLHRTPSRPHSAVRSCLSSATGSGAPAGSAAPDRGANPSAVATRRPIAPTAAWSIHPLVFGRARFPRARGGSRPASSLLMADRTAAVPHRRPPRRRCSAVWPCTSPTPIGDLWPRSWPRNGVSSCLCCPAQYPLGARRPVEPRIWDASVPTTDLKVFRLLSSPTATHAPTWAAPAATRSRWLGWWGTGRWCGRPPVPRCGRSGGAGAPRRRAGRRGGRVGDHRRRAARGWVGPRSSSPLPGRAVAPDASEQ
jgi:hypothetical protein